MFCPNFQSETGKYQAWYQDTPMLPQGKQARVELSRKFLLKMEEQGQPKSTDSKSAGNEEIGAVKIILFFSLLFFIMF